MHDFKMLNPSCPHIRYFIIFGLISTFAIINAFHNCNRRCPRHENAIFHVPEAAGIGDRTSIIYNFGDIAWNLCARLFIPKPCMWLTSTHLLNQSNKVPCNLDWKFYVNVTYPDGSYVPNNIDDFENFAKNMGNYTTISPTTEKNVTKQVEQIKVLYLSNQPIVWKDVNFYWYRSIYNELAKFLKVHNNPSLQNVETAHFPHCTHISKRIEDLNEPVERFMNHHQITTNTTFMHIRRTDAIHACNSSIEAIQQFLIVHKYPKIDSMLISTDEVNTTYLHNLATMLNETLSCNVVYIDLELNSMYPSYDNYRIFLMSKMIRERIPNFLLFRREMECGVVDHIPGDDILNHSSTN